MEPVTNKDGEVVGYHGPAEKLARTAAYEVHTMPVGGYPATTDELLVFMRHKFDQCLALAEAKNARYARTADPFKNLSRGGSFGIAVRMDDKVSRLLTLTEPGCNISGLDESIEDTCRDLINYAALLLALRAYQGGAK